jgi:two-component system nitrogen regulation sensor histidine kinase GlnL
MMAKTSSRAAHFSEGFPPDAALVLNAIARPILAIDGANRVAFLNQAAEQFFEASAGTIIGRDLSEMLPSDSPVFSLIGQVRADGHSITEYGVAIETPKIGAHLVSVDAAAMVEAPESVVLSLHERSIAGKIDRQLVHRGAARSVTAMAAMLAHELKNPLSGIRGAAQLLEQGASDEDRALTRLICDETDRIVALVDRMEMFSDDRPIAREPVNIHEVLEHVRRVARSGFARHLRFIETYDPSLPPVYGNRDLLIQALLNLVKNAAEAVSEDDGEIVLSTGYRHGVRLAVSGSGRRVDLPLVIGVQDNGPGIPEDLRPHLFDPFVTTKVGGKGLGLALVAKVVGDHGGVVEFDGRPRRTLFRLMLPMAPDGAKPA